MRYEFSSRATAALVAAGLLAGLAVAQTVLLESDATAGVADGYLRVHTDAYGSWAQPFGPGGAGPNDDAFNPAGSYGAGPTPFPLTPSCFSNGCFIFVGGVERELLSDIAEWQATTGTGVPAGGFGADTTLTRAVTCPTVAFDTNGDGVNDAARSSFTVTNASGTTNLSFQLTQRVRSVAPGVAAIQLDYTAHNNAAGAITFTLYRAVDGDLVYILPANYGTDQVGTTCNTAGIGQFAAERDRDAAVGYDATGLVVYMGADGLRYVCGKQAHTPTGGAPAMGFGTDVQQFVAFGIPASWQNYVPTVGYNIDGINAAVAGSQDSFIGLDTSVTLAAGGSKTVRMNITYGQMTPAPLCPHDITVNGQVDLGDLAALLGQFGSVGGCLSGDLNNDGQVDISDLALLLASFGAVC